MTSLSYPNISRSGPLDMELDFERCDVMGKKNRLIAFRKSLHFSDSVLRTIDKVLFYQPLLLSANSYEQVQSRLELSDDTAF